MFTFETRRIPPKKNPKICEVDDSNYSCQHLIITRKKISTGQSAKMNNQKPLDW